MKNFGFYGRIDTATERISRALKEKGLFKRPFLYLFAAYAIAFALFYVDYLLQDSLRIEFIPLEYFRYFYFNALSFAAPILAGAVLIGVGLAEGRSFALKKSWTLPLCILIYTIPYYYLYYFYITVDSIEAIVFGLINTVFDCAVFYLQSIIMFFALPRLTRAIAKKPVVEGDAALRESRPMDLSSPVSLAAFILIGIKFLVMLALEIVSTVEYLADFSGSYKIDEIVYILVSYVILLAELIATQYFIFFAKNRIEQKNNITEAEKA